MPNLVTLADAYLINRLQALKEKIKEHKKHLEELEKNVYGAR